MRRFKYSLEIVLDYKTQVLDSLKTKHTAIVRNVNQKKEEIKQLKEQLNGFQYGPDCTKTQGAPIKSLQLYDRCIEGMEKKTDGQKIQLSLLERQEEQRKNEMVAVNIDISRCKKSKGHRFNKHQKGRDEGRRGVYGGICNTRHYGRRQDKAWGKRVTTAGGSW